MVEVTVPAKRRPVGVSKPALNLALAEQNPVMRFPQSAGVYAKMLREDSQVTSVFKAVTLPIRRANWQIHPNGAPDEIVAHVANDLRLSVQGDDPNRPVAQHSGRVSWAKHLEQALYALAFGHMFFEQVYEPGTDGRDHLVKLAPRWPGSLTKITVADDGGLESIQQNASGWVGKRDDVPVIPVERLVAYVFDDVGDQWLGRSVLRPAYKNWSIKDSLLRLELTVLDRNGMGVPVYQGSALADDPQKDIDHGQEIVEGLRSGDHAGASVPAGAELKLLGVSGQLVSARETIAYHDNMIARSVLAHFLNLDGKGGSYALAETQSDLFVQSLQTVAEWINDVANQHVVEDLVRIAFPEYSGPAPRVACDPIASKKDLTPTDLKALIDAKLILTDADLEEEVRRRYNLPPKQKFSEALEAKKARLEMEAEAGVSLSEPSQSVDEAAPGPTTEGEES